MKQALIYSLKVLGTSLLLAPMVFISIYPLTFQVQDTSSLQALTKALPYFLINLLLVFMIMCFALNIMDKFIVPPQIGKIVISILCLIIWFVVIRAWPIIYGQINYQSLKPPIKNSYYIGTDIGKTVFCAATLNFVLTFISILCVWIFKIKPNRIET